MTLKCLIYVLIHIKKSLWSNQNHVQTRATLIIPAPAHCILQTLGKIIYEWSKVQKCFFAFKFRA